MMWHQLIVYGAANSQRQRMYEQLQQSVIDMHNIARLIEQQIGQGQLSADLRNCADRLAMLLKIDVENFK